MEDMSAVQNWLTDFNLNNENVKEGQREDPVIGFFLKLKAEGLNPMWHEVSDQGNGFKLL